MDVTNRSFRLKVQSWLAVEFRAFKAAWELRGGFDPNSFAIRKAWDDLVCQGGWSGLCWPTMYGGGNRPLSDYIIFEEEYARAGCPEPASSIGHRILGPMLLAHGSEEQKKRYIPPLIRNDEMWCQGYSEPHAGSDLASLTTTARRDGNHYVVNGLKTWTSGAQFADFCFVLARTGANSIRHQGISFLLIDLKSAGITIEPIRQITGQEEFCEVRYTNVHVPVNNRIGEENDGWRMAMAAANFERATYFVPKLIRLAEQLKKLWLLMEREVGEHKSTTEALWSDRLTRLAVEVNGMRLLAEKILSAEQPGPESSFSKLLYGETVQTLYDYAIELLADRARLGPDGNSGHFETTWNFQFTFNKALTIAGGASEIHRNIIAEKLLGLPK